MKPIGFISEHTAASTLLHDLVCQLSDGHRRIIPLRYSSMREGSRTANESMQGKRVEVLAVYPRRPKVTKARGHTILVKVNSVLFASARSGADCGIPVLAGVPLIDNLADFTIGVSCAWFLVAPVVQRGVEFQIRLSRPLQVIDLPNGVSGPLTSAEILTTMRSKCREMDWHSACLAMDSVKEPEEGHRGLFGVMYTPFFLAVLSRVEPGPNNG